MILNDGVETIAKHFQLIRVSNNEWHYLNPGLVLDTNSISFCPDCFENHLERPCIIARGHYYGIISSLSKLSESAKNAILLMRLFGWTIHMSNNTISGNYISFASDGLSVCANNILPAIDHNFSSQATFVGTKEQWRVVRKNYKNVHHIPSIDAFDCLKLMCDYNELFKEKGVSIDHSEKVRN